MVIVYDFDGVLNDLNEVVFEAAGVIEKLSSLKYYSIDKNDNLSDEEKAKIKGLYGNTETFKKISLTNRAKEIADQVSDKDSVIIHSLSFNEQIADIKSNMVKSELHGVKLINRIGYKKDKIENASVVVEDCLDGLLQYSSDVHRILIDKPYNKLSTYGIKENEVTVVADLGEAIDYINVLIDKEEEAG